MLQEGEIQPVGSGRIDQVDVRVVASTNRDLAASSIAAGTFREDLYYRLAVVELVVPPLRDHATTSRRGPEFARRYAERSASERAPHPPRRSTPCAPDWPGNVRQLENAVARLVALSNGGEMGPGALTSMPTQPAGGQLEGAREDLALWQRIEAFEREQIEQALAATGGNQSEAARRLRISRSAFVDRLKKYGLTSN